MQVIPESGEPKLSRALSQPIQPGSTYWVAFLVRADSTGIGDAFWTPEGLYDVGAAGLQQNSHVRFVNGPRTSVEASGSAHLVVVRMAGTEARLWVDPVLNRRGAPDAVVTIDSPVELNTAIFKFNTVNGGFYTIDEFRLGTSFEQVAPMG